VTTTAADVEERQNRKTLEGWVLSDKMDKTRTVRIIRRFRHSLYGKVLTRYTKVHAHDEKNESRAGDRVSLMETRPISKLKRWRVVQILEKAKVAQNAEVAAVLPTDQGKKSSKSEAKS
jgi:small subunit ribosomal protein S17